MTLHLSKAEWLRLKEVREIRDLKTAGRLWRHFEASKGLMPTLRGLCTRGLRLIHKEVLPYGPEEDPEWYTKYIKSDACKMLDCWPNGGPNKKRRRELRYLRGRPDATGQSYFKDLGMIGGYFRFHAEVCEMNRMNPSYDEARVSWQKSTEYRHDSGSYTHKWFTKLQDKVLDPTGQTAGLLSKAHMTGQTAQQVKQNFQRARYSRKKSERNPPEYIKPFIHRPKGKENYITGVTLHRQSTWDRMYLISQLYGLPPGATISGTTTDHMFTLFHVLGTAETDKSKLGKQFIEDVYKYMPFIILLPGVQMVRQYHHALVETAAALSLNDMISYHVGYYSSLLMPWPTGKCTWDKALYKDIKQVLRLADAAVPHVYAMGDAVIKTKKMNDPVAVMVNPRNEHEIKAHYDAALLNPETVSRFEEIPERIDWNYIENKLRALRVNRKY